MKSMTVALLKSGFSGVLDDIRRGEEITIEYGKGHRKLAVIIPYAKYQPHRKKVGILEGKASFKIRGNFKISDRELLAL